ncbi:MAG: hypothetical protein LBE95_00695 [Holosporaceae bacterium]|jgi:hypothetical protein|nr:hypothetical protein [Holosporaceae bacterium]
MKKGFYLMARLGTIILSSCSAYPSKNLPIKIKTIGLAAIYCLFLFISFGCVDTPDRNTRLTKPETEYIENYDPPIYDDLPDKSTIKTPAGLKSGLRPLGLTKSEVSGFRYKMYNAILESENGNIKVYVIKEQRLRLFFKQRKGQEYLVRLYQI